MAGSILKTEAYDGYQMQEGQHDNDSWDVDMRDASQQFAYCSMVLDLEMFHCRLYVHFEKTNLTYMYRSLMNYVGGCSCSI